MNRGRRKNLKQAASEQDFTLRECQSIPQFVSLRSSNQIDGDNSLALFPSKIPDGTCIRRVVSQQERRRRKRRRGRDMCEMIPLDLVIEILIRLPPKSLMRSKCVSRQWLSLISCRYFCHRLFTVNHIYTCA